MFGVQDFKGQILLVDDRAPAAENDGTIFSINL
jgi:hypothetical protein